MAEIVIPMEKLAVKKIELEKKFNSQLYNLRKKIDRYSHISGKNGNRSYSAILNAFSYQSAVESILLAALPFENKIKQSTIFSFYIASTVGLEQIVEKQEETVKTKEFFSDNNIDLTQLMPSPFSRLAEMYCKIVDICAEQFELEDITCQYFRWIKEESLKYSEEKSMLELDTHLKKNPLVIKEKNRIRRFNSFGTPRHTDQKKYTWNDIGGYSKIKEKCMDIAILIKNYEFMKKRQEEPLPTGILFYGPPGTGKTTLAKIIANESGVPFEMIDRASIASTYKDGSVEKINKIFEKIKSYVVNGISPAAILFIDELDSIGSTRGDHREDDKVVNTLLTNMDGKSTPGVIYFAATNRPDMIDYALKRPGRFTMQMEVGYPSQTDRKDIFRSIMDSRKKYAVEHNQESNLYNGVDCEKLAKESDKFTGDDIRYIIDEVIRKQSLAYIKNKTQIKPITTEHLIDEIKTYKTKK